MLGAERLATHPFQRWPAAHRRLALLAVAVLAVLPVALGTVVKPLHEDDPGGESIVEFELAGTVDRADEILATWREEGVVDDAKALQLVDLVYPLIYAAALAGACVAAAGAWSGMGREGMAKAGSAMAWVAFAAATLDYAENLGLGISLWHEPASPWPQLALVAALGKFAAIGVSLAYGVSGLVPTALRNRAGV